MSTGSASSLTPPEWVAKPPGEKLQEAVATKPSVAVVAPLDPENPLAAAPAKTAQDDDSQDEPFPLPSLRIVSDNENWLDTHQNPDSPIHVSPPHSPDHIPTGRDRHERWDHWLFHHRKRHGLVEEDENEQEGSVAAGKAKKHRGWLKGSFHAIASEKPLKYRKFFLLLVAIVMLGAWGTALWLVKERKAAPKGDIFALLCIWVFSFCLGEAVRSFTHPLLGSILAGFILRFIPGIQPHLYINGKTQGHVRSLALVVILVRAGMSLDLKTLGKLPVLCGLMPTVPLISEACFVAILMHALLKFTWKWAFMAGFLVSAVSPAVVVPVLLQLAGEGYGLEAGIPSLVLAVAALCDVFSIAGFSVWQTITFEKISIVEACFRAPQELVIGIVAGLALGALAAFVSPKSKIVTGHEPLDQLKALKRTKNIDDRIKGYQRSGLTLGLGFFAYFGFHHLEYNGSGAMSVFVLGAAVAMGWGRNRTARVQSNLASIWIYVAQPLLFGIIGININPKLFYTNLGFLWKAVVILLVAMFGRMVITFLAAYVGHLNNKEKLFLAFAWIPKATVQAALGPVALAAVAANFPKSSPNYQKYHEWATDILNLSILAILLTAPVGATIMAFVGPRLLTKNPLPAGGAHLAAE